MCGKRGFTLIELLVVIAIIALLMSILMPSLVRVRQNAKTTVCIMNMRTWGTIIMMYTTENEGCLHGEHAGSGMHWMEAYRRDYCDEDKIRCCPTATKTGAKQPFTAWTGAETHGHDPNDYGSYGENGWVQNSKDEYFGPGQYWKTVNNVKAGNRVPLIMGCTWMHGIVNGLGWAEKTPPYSGGWSGGGCIDRMYRPLYA